MLLALDLENYHLQLHPALFVKVFALLGLAVECFAIVQYQLRLAVDVIDMLLLLDQTIVHSPMTDRLR
jgi:hypothetical protein